MPGGPTAPRRVTSGPRSPWIANSFGRYNGDGYLIYPGAEGKPWSSIRFEAFRDGLEDYEYLWTLNDLMTKVEASKKTGPAVDAARKLLTIDDLVHENGAFDTDPAKYAVYRAKMAEAIVGLKALVGE